MRIYQSGMGIPKQLAILHQTKQRMQFAIAGASGQAMTEYIFLVVAVGLVCIPIAQLLPAAVQGYLRPFYYTISRSVP